MIAFVLDRLGLDPAFLIGGEIPQLGGNARAGEGWLVAEGDESDRSIELAAPADRGGHQRRPRSPRRRSRPSRGARRCSSDWLAQAPESVRGEELEPAALELGVPGEHNRRNAAAALAALELAGVLRDAAERVLPEFTGAGRRFELRGEARRRHGLRRLRPSSDARSRRRSRRRVARPARVACSSSSSRTSTRARGTSPESSRTRSAPPTRSRSRDIYAAREEPVEGVEGRLVVEALVTERPGMPVAWAPEIEDAVRFLSRRARPGDSS